MDIRDNVTSFEVDGLTYWIDEGLKDFTSKWMALQREIFDLSFMFGTLPAEKEKEVYEKHGFKWEPRSSSIGYYVITDIGLMYQCHGKLFQIGSNPGDISETPFEGEVRVIRNATGFDF